MEVRNKILAWAIIDRLEHKLLCAISFIKESIDHIPKKILHFCNFPISPEFGGCHQFLFSPIFEGH
jgi:hypothetical protein